MFKKKDGLSNICVDYLILNDVTHKDAQHMQRIDIDLEFLAGAKIFGKIDAKSGYHLIDIAF